MPRRSVVPTGARGAGGPRRPRTRPTRCARGNTARHRACGAGATLIGRIPRLRQRAARVRLRGMSNNLASFAIHADDVDRCRRFYEAVLGWKFEPWGPPQFYLVHTGADKKPGIQGLLLKR